MATWIALFRGINVVGNNRLLMKDLVRVLEDEGFTDVRTYIQSGNAVFNSVRGTSRSLADRIGRAVEARHGFRPRIAMLSPRELAEAVAGNPFRAAVAEPKSLHLFFMAHAPPAPDHAALDRIRVGAEAFAFRGRVFYLHTPHGFPTSKLAASAERLIGIDATARNWNTVSRLLEMVTTERAPS